MESRQSKKSKFKCFFINRGIHAIIITGCSRLTSAPALVAVVTAIFLCALVTSFVLDGTSYHHSVGSSLFYLARPRDAEVKSMMQPIISSSPPRLFDVILYNGEIDMLYFRYKTLDPVVDIFVLAESNWTFSGRPKPLHFEDNKIRLQEFAHKIRHVVVNDVPNEGNAWNNEAFQRNAASRGLQYDPPVTNNDLIILSDADEVPDPRTLGALKQHGSLRGCYSFKMDFYYYSFKFKNPEAWCKAKIIDGQTFLSDPFQISDSLRGSGKVCPTLPLRGGWHMSYFGDVSFIKNKIESFSHQEYNNERFKNAEAIQIAIASGVDLYGRDGQNLVTIDLSENIYLPYHYQILMPDETV